MHLPFTKEQFFDLFAAYNGALRPALIALWIASFVISGLLLTPQRLSDRWISALLATHWAWSGLAYHIAFFTSINPAAWLFATLFLLQATFLFWWGVVKARLSFAPWRNAWTPMAWALVAYSLVYPGINAIQHQTLSRIPTFGVPCPTMIFTAGLLMLAAPRSWTLSIVPVIWSVIGGSAAFFLEVPTDYALPIAGIALTIFSTQSRGGLFELGPGSGSPVAHPMLTQRLRSKRAEVPVKLPTRRWWSRVGLGLLACLVAIQLVPYGRDHLNPPIGSEPNWDSPATRALAKQACFDCHSNETNWPPYARIAPASWLVLHDVSEGRAALNFSEWQRPQEKSKDAAEELLEGEMPPAMYRMMHAHARLSDVDRDRLARGLAGTLGESHPEAKGDGR